MVVVWWLLTTKGRFANVGPWTVPYSIVQLPRVNKGWPEFDQSKIFKL